MLKSAPKFYEIAKRIVEITEGCILVAHNAKFDSRVLKTEFNRLGFSFERKTLCTVELSKQLIPNLASYSLGKLVRSLGIPVSDRHRAAGDATATVKLFKMLLDKDIEKTIIKDAIRTEPKYQMEPKLTEIISNLPAVTGVYYIHKHDGEIIYIGKSKNIKSRINQHFTGQTTKSKKIRLEVATVSYEKTGSELVALLKESEEIKRNKPKFNRALRRTIFTHGLFSFKDSNGYINLKIERIKGNQKPITTFSNINAGKSFINKMIEKKQLCQKLCGLYKTKSSCFGYDIKTCLGACVSVESNEAYNKRVLSLIKSNNFKDQNMILIDSGREVDERSAILIENGVYKGFAYFNLNFQINKIDVLKSILTPMEHNKDAKHIIQSFMRRNKRLKIIKI